MEIGMTQSFVDNFVSSFGITHCSSFSSFAKPDGSSVEENIYSELNISRATPSNENTATDFSRITNNNLNVSENTNDNFNATADNMEIGMTQSFVDSFVSSFGITHCSSFSSFAKPDGSVNKLSFPN
jgi:hypothetical protein